jgi:hypothetical protein
MTIDELLERARSTYRRVSAAEAAEALANGGVIIDTRTYEQRREHGIVPGALVLSRNVLEWRVDTLARDTATSGSRAAPGRSW